MQLKTADHADYTDAEGKNRLLRDQHRSPGDEPRSMAEIEKRLSFCWSFHTIMTGFGSRQFQCEVENEFDGKTAGRPRQSEVALFCGRTDHLAHLSAGAAGRIPPL
jgi:hypothetical protein